MRAAASSSKKYAGGTPKKSASASRCFLVGLSRKPLAELPDVGGRDRRAAAGTNLLGHLLEGVLTPLRRMDRSEEVVELL